MICKYCGKEMIYNEEVNTWNCKECLKKSIKKFSLKDLESESEEIKIIPFTKGLDKVVEKLKCSGDVIHKFYILYFKFNFEGSYLISKRVAGNLLSGKISGNFSEKYGDFGWDYTRGSKIKEISNYDFELAEKYNKKLLEDAHVKKDKNEISGVLKRFRREKAKDIGRMHNMWKYTKNDEYFRVDKCINVEKAEKETYYLPVYIVKDSKQQIVYVVNGQTGNWAREKWQDVENKKYKSYMVRYIVGSIFGLILLIILKYIDSIR